MPSSPPSGFLLVHKPSGMTSHDVVDAVRNLFNTQQVGHAGTLDPTATGLLIVGIGTATKKLGHFLRLPKTYEAGITLGATSTTDDAEGMIEAVGGRHAAEDIPSQENVEHVLKEFVGSIEQVPPVYSAIKVRGVPAHRRMRRGESVTLRPRRITIESLELLDYTYPHLRIRCHVSSGTYIRALARDIGQKLEVGGYLSALSRTAIGPFQLTDATILTELRLHHLRQKLES